MPICPYFVSGKCNYGNKCYNLHVNIGTNIQTTAKSSVAGKQWLLSCFAPFEGDTLLPNFIEDRSFEEVRWEHYGSRASNTTHLAEQKFNQEWVRASNNMNRLVTMEPITQSYLVEVFGVSGKKTATFPGDNVPSASNPFATATQPTGSSIFGGGASNSNVFGGQQQQQSGNPFGHPNQAPGGFSFPLGRQGNSHPTPASSIFGGGSSNIFSQTTATQQNQMQGGVNIMQSTGNIFGPPQPTSAFGHAPQPSQLQPGGNIFQQNVFGGSAAVVQPMPIQPNAFGSQPPPPPNPFQSQSPFGQPVNQQPVAPGFGTGFNNLGQSAAPATEANIFGAPQAPSNIFGMQTNYHEPPPPNSTIYSSLDQLSSEQLTAFQSTEFTLGCIPNHPPPKELCF